MKEDKIFITEIWSKKLLQRFINNSFFDQFILPLPKRTFLQRMKIKLSMYQDRFKLAYKVLKGEDIYNDD